MVKIIFWRENYVNGKTLKTPNKILPGERRNLRGDRSAKSKYNGFMKFHQVLVDKGSKIKFNTFNLHFLIFIIKLIMAEKKSQYILPNFSSCLQNLHNFFNPYYLCNYFFINFL